LTEAPHKLHRTWSDTPPEVQPLRPHTANGAPPQPDKSYSNAARTKRDSGGQSSRGLARYAGSGTSPGTGGPFGAAGRVRRSRSTSHRQRVVDPVPASA